MLWTTKVLRNKIINEQQQPIILGQVVKDDNYWICSMLPLIEWIHDKIA